MNSKAPGPTPKQLRYLRDLACARGVTFLMPQTMAEASREIERLKRQATSSRIEVALDEQAVREQARTGLHGPAVRPDEIEGYGSTAAWAGRGRDSS